MSVGSPQLPSSSSRKKAQLLLPLLQAAQAKRSITTTIGALLHFAERCHVQSAACPGCYHCKSRLGPPVSTSTWLLRRAHQKCTTTRVSYPGSLCVTQVLSMQASTTLLHTLYTRSPDFLQRRYTARVFKDSRHLATACLIFFVLHGGDVQLVAVCCFTLTLYLAVLVLVLVVVATHKT